MGELSEREREGETHAFDGPATFWNVAIRGVDPFHVGRYGEDVKAALMSAEVSHGEWVGREWREVAACRAVSPTQTPTRPSVSVPRVRSPLLIEPRARGPISANSRLRSEKRDETESLTAVGDASARVEVRRNLARLHALAVQRRADPDGLATEVVQVGRAEEVRGREGRARRRCPGGGGRVA